MRKFFKDTRGAYALEFAILFPVMIIAIGGALALTQHQSLSSQALFLAQTGAMASANYATNTGSTRQGVEPQVTAMLTVNATLTLDTFATMDAPQFAYLVTGGLTQTQVTVTVHTLALFPMFGDVLTSTQTAVQ